MEKIRDQNRLRKQRQREKESLLLNSPIVSRDMSRDSHDMSRDSHATDIDKEKDKEIEKELNTLCANKPSKSDVDSS